MKKWMLLFLLLFCFSVHARPVQQRHVVKTFVEITVCDKPTFIYVIDTHGEVLGLPVKDAVNTPNLYQALMHVTGKIYNVDTGNCIHT